jgi:hypothetical protein
MSYGRVLDVLLARRERADHHLAGVHTDPNLNWCAAVGAQPFGVAVNFFLHA